MPKVSHACRVIHGLIALYHAVALILLYSGWPFRKASAFPPALGSLYGDSFEATDETKGFTCFGLNSQIIVGVLYAKVALLGDAPLAATLCLPRGLIVLFHAFALMTGRVSPGFALVVFGETVTLLAVYASLPESALVSVVGVPPTPGPDGARKRGTPKKHAD